MSGNILLPTDGSLPAIVASDKAVQMAKERGATLTILKVEEQTPIMATEMIAESSALQRPTGEDGVKYAKELADQNNVEAKVMIRQGAVVGEILKASEETKADMIVMGTSSLKGLNRLYLGSVAQSVVHQAPTTVVVVKPTEDELEKAMEYVRRIIAPVKEIAVVSITKTKVFKVGLSLFSFYIACYSIFTLGGTFFRPQFRDLFGGLNVGIVAGLLLIIMAIVMAIGYNWYADRSEKGGA